MTYEVVSASIKCIPVRVMGIAMFKASVFTETGRILFETTLWSEAGARTAAYRWIQRQAYEAQTQSVKGVR